MIRLAPRWMALVALAQLACGPGAGSSNTTPAASQPANDEVEASDDEAYLGTSGTDTDGDDQGSDESMSDDDDAGDDDEDYDSDEDDESYDDDEGYDDDE